MWLFQEKKSDWKVFFYRKIKKFWDDPGPVCWCKRSQSSSDLHSPTENQPRQSKMENELTVLQISCSGTSASMSKTLNSFSFSRTRTVPSMSCSKIVSSIIKSIRVCALGDINTFINAVTHKAQLKPIPNFNDTQPITQISKHIFKI